MSLELPRHTLWEMLDSVRVSLTWLPEDALEHQELLALVRQCHDALNAWSRFDFGPAMRKGTTAKVRTLVERAVLAVEAYDPRTRRSASSVVQRRAG